MQVFINPDKNCWNEILQRPAFDTRQLEGTVAAILEDVKLNGDAAVKKYALQFDKVELGELKVTAAEIEEAIQLVDEELKVAIKIAKDNITAFHQSQKEAVTQIETTSGVVCWRKSVGIEKVGLYIPGGTAPLFSTLLMLGMPAMLAGCKEIVVCTPPDKNGKINPVILYVAQLIGLKDIYKAGGVQAIGAMAYGTATIDKVYKIFGPGNQYVTAAKQYATQFGVAIDMPAGPSELLVIADETAIPKYVASDLLSQAEHGADSQVLLVTNSKVLLEGVAIEIVNQLEALPRKEIAAKAIENSKLIYCESTEDILNLVNEYGPEHLIICSKDEAFYLEGIQNAGSVFLGNFTPESAGDYASGTNHTLPTNGFSKNYSGVNLDSFLKAITYQKISAIGIQNIGKTIEIMADAEGLQGHKNAVTLRLTDLNLNSKK